MADTGDPVTDSVFAHGLTIINIVALCAVLVYQIVMKWLDNRAKAAEDAKLDSLITAITELMGQLKLQQQASADFENEMKGTFSGVRRMMTEILNRNAGVMNRDNSLRIIDQSFTNVIRDIVMIFTSSLESNGYDERREFIKNRVKTTIGQTLDSLKNSLSYFQMSVDIRPFFRSAATADQGDRYVLANELWDLIEPLYRSSAPIKDRLEEMRLNVPNKIRDYVAATRSTIVRDDDTSRQSVLKT